MTFKQFVESEELNWAKAFVWDDSLTMEQAERIMKYHIQRHDPDYKFRIVPSQFNPGFYQIEGLKIAP